MSRLSSPAEWVAPLTPIISLVLLLLGPILFPRFYVLFLFIYFTAFLYQQVNHVIKFYLSSVKIRANINKWNQLNRNDKSQDDKAKIQLDTFSSNARERHVVQIEEDEEKLEQGQPMITQVLEPANYIHTFVIPNYGEPEALLKDSIGRLAAHR
jgi:hypothetical protein